MYAVECLENRVISIQGAPCSWNVMGSRKTIFQAWKVVENSKGRFESWKMMTGFPRLLENPGFFL